MFKLKEKTASVVEKIISLSPITMSDDLKKSEEKLDVPATFIDQYNCPLTELIFNRYKNLSDSEEESDTSGDKQ